MKILVIGATGPTGRELVNRALTLNHSVTALVRNPAKAGFAPSVNLVVGDVLDRSTLEKAVDGQDAVVCSLGSSISGPFKEMSLLSQGTRNLVEAMRTKCVDRLVCITGIGAGESKGHGPWYYNWLVQPLMLRGVYEDKTRQEEIVRGSGLTWTLVRPGMLTNGDPKGPGTVRALIKLAGVHAGTISRADVADFCLVELADGHYIGQAPVITY